MILCDILADVFLCVVSSVAASLPVILPPRVEGRHFLAGHKHFVVVKGRYITGHSLTILGTLTA